MPVIFSEGSGVADSIYGKSQAPIRMFIEKKAEAFEAQSVIKNLFSKQTSKHYAEKYSAMNAMENGFEPVGENGATPYDSMSEGPSKLIANVTWKNGFAISREMVDDANLMDLKQKPSAFITSYERTKEQFGAAIYGGAISGNTAITFKGKNFDVTSSDGLCLFHTAHVPSVDKNKKNTQCNKFSDVFSYDALSALETEMQNICGDTGELLAISPDTIVIPNDYELKKEVFAVIGADKDPATANNGFNYQFGRWNVIVWAYLNRFVAKGAKPWMLIDSAYNEEYAGAVWQDRTDLEVRSFIDENNHSNKWTGFARFNAGFNDWRFASLGGVSDGKALIG